MTKELRSEEQIFVHAKNLGFEILDELHHFPLVQDRVKKLPYSFVRQYVVLPLKEDEKSILVATFDPFDLTLQNQVRWLLKKEIHWVVSSKDILLAAIEHCYHVTEEESKKVFESTSLSSSLSPDEGGIEGYDLLERSEKNPVIHLLNTIILEAIQQNASDIHFEPQEKELMVRYRIDGVLLKRRSPPVEYQANLMTRIKIMAKLDIAEKRLPQDGRMKLKLGNREIDFRVSTIPISYGERIALRILDKGNVVLGLDQLGIPSEILKQLRDVISIPEGILLVTGPTGSGKTTTLYSIISEIHSSEVNIMTIEDPVEYKLPEIAQIGVNPKIQLTFAKGLRHILRQDPDIIMIGEIRDRETAEIAVQASLTGHLVFSTLHTNDAPSAITRLVDMGIEPYLLSSSVLGVVAQRLVRKICPHCKTAYEPSAEESLKLKIPPTEKMVWYKGKGCEECYYTGYKGRHGVYEFLKINSVFRAQIVKSSVEAETLRKVAKENGLVDLFSSGVELVQKGITTSGEVLRVCRGFDVE